ncbi:NAD(P)/FAD-dependent oxidoreductase [Aquimarina sp. ERC-38]|uniref:dihydrolipoyl dehydrogenase family protein n=1 Tax=Aquimarina sp. ERC-38 TaxID=2949996 RepID=UPI00224699C5|nr:NAD(P)/FAD-dependent oxidoreductase [Aquimarina sp. ERC-38]UZO81945.1 NAD(P)/FAD-dependent oxidoreductase [Aquimarina sp. ERC-38]
MGNLKFDVFVIGSGIAGQKVAEKCVKEGKKVAIAENKVLGGVCSNRGCDPKKVLLGPTEVVHVANRLLHKGISEKVKTNWKDVMQYKKEFTDPVPDDTEEKLKDLGITLFNESPYFIDENTLFVSGQEVKADKIVIATGLIPRKLEVEGGQFTKTSEDFLSLEELPKDIIFIGGGYIGMEFAHMSARMGTKVTVIQHGNLPLTIFEKEMVQFIVKASEDLGIKFIFNAELEKIEATDTAKTVHYKVEDTKGSCKANIIFNTSGRVPSIEKLKLENANVDHGDNGIKVNAYLQSISNQNVYACGDVADNAVPLTPFSGREGKIVAYNILNGNSKEADFPVIPTVAFTLPNIASVGLSEEKAKEKYDEINVICKDASSFYNAKRVNEKIYAFKTITDKKSGKILGAHLVGPEAGEIINLFSMAIYNNMTVDQIKDMVFTYPTWSSDIGSMFTE